MNCAPITTEHLSQDENGYSDYNETQTVSRTKFPFLSTEQLKQQLLGDDQKQTDKNFLIWFFVEVRV